MADTFEKITGATFEPDHRRGLVWIETAETDDEGRWYQFWMLVEQATDRVLVTIDGPTRKQICYGTSIDGGGRRTYISLEGAKRNALAAAMQIMADTGRDSALRRKARREARK